MIEVQSDHQNLQSFMKQPRINSRQARWLIFLTLYNFIIRHRPGLLNPADGLSRQPDYMALAEGDDLTPVRSALYEPVVLSTELRLSHRSNILDRDKYLYAIPTTIIPLGQLKIFPANSNTLYLYSPYLTPLHTLQSTSTSFGTHDYYIPTLIQYYTNPIVDKGR